MKSIYISFPITGQEETYEERMNAAVAYVKAKYPEYDAIITPKGLAECFGYLYKLGSGEKPNYAYYLLKDIEELCYCDAIFMCKGWERSKGCLAEHAFAQAIGIDILFQPL